MDILDLIASIGGHKGKVRSFSHVDGNYATHVYLEVNLLAEAWPIRSVLRDVITEARKDLPALQTGTDVLPPHSHGIADLPAVYHVSLSRVLPIRYSDIQSLVATLQECLARTARFEITLAGLEAFTNDNRERTFLALSVGKGRQQVCKAISRVNKAFLQHGLQQFYTDARPHASIAWMLGDEEAALQHHIMQTLKSHPHEGLAGRQVDWSQQIVSINCKIGKQIYYLWREEFSGL